MDDFTKEELKQIADALLYSMTALDNRKESLMAIRETVLTMIDAYCEHEWNEMFADREYFRCTKCDKEIV